MTASLWRPKERMEVHELGGFQYSFVFYHILDMQRVLEGGPWSFEQNMLVCNQLVEDEDPHNVKLQGADMWIQVYDIPKGFISENVLKNVGNAIGRYIRSDPINFNGMWKEYVRIRVALNVEKPLKRRMKLKRDSNAWNWINFKYERMSSFCFVCGIIGHLERECNVVYVNPEKVVERAYGAWLKAPNRNNKAGPGARWLRIGNEGGTRWSANKNIGMGSSNTAYGGRKVDERFMDVDGGIPRSFRGSRVYQGPPDIMSLLAWNCRGLANSRAIRFLKETVYQYRPSIVFLSETLVKNKKIADICRAIGFSSYHAVDVQGHGGGLALLWKIDGGVQVLDSCNNYIDFEVSHDQEDFNDMLFAHEKKGGRPHPRGLLKGFSDMIIGCGLIDLGFEGDKFTWEKSRGTKNWVQERLDRCLVNQGWKNLFPEVVVKVGDVSTSDHIPIFPSLNRKVYVQKGRRFKFENMWIREKDCYGLIKDCWNAGV
ncbi:uncharacterized protein LOC141705706 [Apium graveolens]|uniref:uncharacterized protein LOC141705706 n=1 Tax=Apium graveolens TaxID=4045 RepID=UPI003D796397